MHGQIRSVVLVHWIHVSYYQVQVHWIHALYY
jgi:hypothetical protein